MKLTEKGPLRGIGIATFSRLPCLLKTFPDTLLEVSNYTILLLLHPPFKDPPRSFGMISDTLGPLVSFLFSVLVLQKCVNQAVNALAGLCDDVL